MNRLIVLAHPDPNSLCHSIAEKIQHICDERGDNTKFSNLWEQNFSPVPPLEEFRRRFGFDSDFLTHSRDLKEAEHVIIIHPDWWSGPPAILKGWVDRIFTIGLAFEYTGSHFLEKSKKGLLGGKKFSLFITSDSEKTNAHRFWTETVLPFCSVEDVEYFKMEDLHNKTRFEITSELDEVLGKFQKGLAETETL
jgi:NAD(P)H dehydrogenase (quinone)